MKLALTSEKENIFSMKQTLKIFLLILISANNSVLFSQVQSASLKNQIDNLFTSKFFNSTQASVEIYNLTENKTVYSKNEKLLLRPASALKLLTTSSALIFLDDYNFKTSIYYEGTIEDSVCKGNIYIIGGCDPNFTVNDLDSLSKEIKSFGIKKIEGNIYADISMIDSLYWGEGWMWDDDPTPFAPYLSALNINGNSITVSAHPAEIGTPAEIELIPKTNAFKINNSSKTASVNRSSLSVVRSRNRQINSITVKGSIPPDSRVYTTSFSVYDPVKYFLSLMEESFNRNGISISGITDIRELSEDAEEIFTFERHIDSVIVNTNKKSDNLAAEMILRALANEYYGKPASAINGIKLIDSLITFVGFDPKEYRIADGSGLSHYNLISAELVNAVLKYIYYNEEEVFIKLYNSLPIAGYDGTLQNRMMNSNTYRKVRGKTGTLSGISSLAGYMTDNNNNLIAFTILFQNYTGTAKTARDLQDRLCEIIHNTNTIGN